MAYNKYGRIGAQGSNGHRGTSGIGGATMSIGGFSPFVSTYSAGIPVSPRDTNNISPTQCPKCNKKIKAGQKHKCDSGLRGLLKHV